MRRKDKNKTDLVNFASLVRILDSVARIGNEHLSVTQLFIALPLIQVDSELFDTY
jgi:hypothetical protein